MFQGMRYVYEVYKEMSFSKAARKSLYLPAVPKRRCQKGGAGGGISHL